MPSLAAELAHEEEARRHPERETLELATAGAAKVLGVDHGVTKALARASLTMAPPRHTARGPSHHPGLAGVGRKARLPGRGGRPFHPWQGEGAR